MSTQASRNAKLLHADEEQLDRASIQIADGTAFVVLVCPEDARAAALSRLRGRLKGLALPEPVELGTAEEVLSALREQAGQRDRVLSIVLGRDVAGALDALNLHREKLLAGGPVLVWLDDVDALRVLRERAPDAYSFRSTLVLVKGDGGALPLPSAEEPEAVVVARKRLKRARLPLDKAAAGLEVAEQLRRLEKLDEAKYYIRDALLSLPVAGRDDEALLRAQACMVMASLENAEGKTSAELIWKQRAMAELDSVSLRQKLSPQVLLLAHWPGPFHGHDRLKAEEALSLANRFGIGPEERAKSLVSLSAVAIAQGNSRRARQLFNEANILASSLDIEDAAWLTLYLGDIYLADGQMSEAETSFREALHGALSRAIPIGAIAERMSILYLARDELDAAEELGRSIATVDGYRSEKVRGDIRAAVTLERGMVDGGLALLRDLLHGAQQQQNDKIVLRTCMSLVAVAEAARDCGRISQTELDLVQSDVDLAADLILSIAGPSGPAWYPIQTQTLRALVRSLAPDKLAHALTLGREAVDLARRTYPDLLPETGRILVEHLLLANQPDEALSVIAEVEPLALETGYLKERARLLANRIRALVQKNEPASTITPHIVAFREALAATDSKRITAETLLELARRLPAAATTPDPFDLADEAHRLFLAMPMPAQEARCLEVMGDVLVARGRPDEAKTRYRTARARLERYGLGLRLPKINEKIEKLG